MKKIAAKIGILGGGQLARMLAQVLHKWGLAPYIYCQKPHEPAVSLAEDIYLGSFDDYEKLKHFFTQCDVVTIENEFIDAHLLARIVDESATPCYPSAQAFAQIDDKIKEKSFFENLGIPVPAYSVIETKEDIDTFFQDYGPEIILKIAKGGYDGYGNKKIQSPQEAYKVLEELGSKTFLLEERLLLKKEMAVQVVGGENDFLCYPLVETIQENHICTMTVTTKTLDQAPQYQKIREYALSAARALKTRGIFAFEFFETEDGRLLINESAPRVHNSGHYTIEGCPTSQFENHLRSILNLPLGSCQLLHEITVMQNLLGQRDGITELQVAPEILEDPTSTLHIYGKKDVRSGRKMGHLTSWGSDLSLLKKKVQNYQKDIHL